MLQFLKKPCWKGMWGSMCALGQAPLWEMSLILAKCISLPSRLLRCWVHLGNSTFFFASCFKWNPTANLGNWSSLQNCVVLEWHFSYFITDNGIMSKGLGTGGSEGRKAASFHPQTVESNPHIIWVVLYFQCWILKGFSSTFYSTFLFGRNLTLFNRPYCQVMLWFCSQCCVLDYEILNSVFHFLKMMILQSGNPDLLQISHREISCSLSS